jgi:hypothetical protein
MSDQSRRLAEYLEWSIERLRAERGLPPERFTTPEFEYIRARGRLERVIRELELQAIREWTALAGIRKVYREAGHELPPELRRHWPEIRRDYERSRAAAEATLGPLASS